MDPLFAGPFAVKLQKVFFKEASLAKKKKAVTKKKATKKAVTKKKATKKAVTKKKATKKAVTKKKTVKKASVSAKKMSEKTDVKTLEIQPKILQRKARKDPLLIKKLTRAEEKALLEASEMTRKWLALYRRSSNTDAPNYSMGEKYGVSGPIEHKTLGWGYILSNVNDRLEIIFKKGVKTLISNYD